MRKRKVFLYSIFIVLLFTPIGGAEDTSTSKLFYEAGNYYEIGQYDKAVEEYKKIIASGAESGPIEYNLGNAYFRAGDVANAILSYERAKRLMPRDADLNANYRFATNQIRGRVLSKKGIWSWRPLRLYVASLTINELILILSGTYILTLLIFAVGLYWPQVLRKLSIVTVLLILSFMCNLYITWHKISLVGTEAIVMDSEVQSRFAPIDAATKFFNLYKGMNIVILSEKSGWYKVRRQDGKIGWIKKEQLEII